MAININNLANNQVTARQAEQQQVQQQNNQGAQQSAQAQANTARQDSVSLTNNAQQLNNATKKANASSGFDQEKVDKIKKAIADGSYKVDAERLAANMITKEGNIFGL
ncbi:flagellar biosynthesis anti-sigma factor FlgM [Saccharobesus litoralis]|uniref:Negative regulator of flagellin synthesis n=1 Tax=Saccharobesus litoralis TaxID=2172099 RepID=A0A2S0VUR3_9ALTE|nr:flagellar biosynthesis anti-sigma factor FlgM [Saccharobesus litoralis]AWB67961.1 flagellar biosynthesis anti-sigma factor FlgM [Saccharobesus litoralis]